VGVGRYAHLLMDTARQGGDSAGGGATSDPVGSGPSYPDSSPAAFEDKDPTSTAGVHRRGPRRRRDARQRLHRPGADRVLGSSQGGGIALAVTASYPGPGAAHIQAPFCATCGRPPG